MRVKGLGILGVEFKVLEKFFPRSKAVSHGFFRKGPTRDFGFRALRVQDLGLGVSGFGVRSTCAFGLGASGFRFRV